MVPFCCHEGRSARERPAGQRSQERWLVSNPDASPLGAQFYELGTNRPLYLDRDSVFRYDFTEISYERRSGYSYHRTTDEYPRWGEKHDLPK